MTQEDVIRLAKEAGVTDAREYGESIPDKCLLTFSKLVAEHEREACAKECEKHYEYYGYKHVFAKSIRARGQA